MNDGSGYANGRNLVICCDGTGNIWTPENRKTNVVKLVESLIHDPARQIYYYDPGVGTADDAMTGIEDDSGLGWQANLRRIAGLAWGRGVWTNVANAYRFLMQNHKPLDRIYIFGFSRGAFTARSIAGIVHMFGVLRPEHNSMVPTLTNVYRSKDTPQRAARAASLSKSFSVQSGQARIEFIGVWDTVQTVGLFDLLLSNKIKSPPTVKSSFGHVRHAVSLDETRWTYEPRLYIDTTPLRADQSLQQIWFAGVHSDVGGSYKEDGAANEALHWMVREANEHGLLVDFDQLGQNKADPFGQLHDQVVRAPLWATAGAFRRQGVQLPKFIHESVRLRAEHPDTQYTAPGIGQATVLSTRNEVIRPNGRLESMAYRVASAPQPPFAEALQAWHWAWLIASAALAVLFYILGGESGSNLAKLQLFGGGFLELGRELDQWSAGSISRLLWLDTAMIAAYAALIPMLLVFASRFAGKRHLQPNLWKALTLAGGYLPVADLLENGFTAMLLRCHDSSVLSVLTHFCALAKLVLFSVFIALLVYVFLVPRREVP